jgi:type IV secretory pathway TraG/TraD family ATPase VirD4
MTLEEATSGTNAFLIAYFTILAGLVVGQRIARAPPRRLLWMPVIALPTFILVAMVLELVNRFDDGIKGLPPILQLLLATCIIFVVGMLVGLYFGGSKPDVEHQRGTRLLDNLKNFGKTGDNSALTFAGVPVPQQDETKHFKIMGTTGTGKSTVILQLLNDALARGDRAVVADPDGSYMDLFYDPKRGDVVLNPFHEHAARWDIFAEISLPHDSDQLARSLVPDYEGSDRNWRGYARTFLTALLRQLHRTEDPDIAKLYYLLVMAPVEELKDLLEATPAGPFFGRDNGKYFDSVRSVAMAHLGALEHVARQEATSAVSVRKWIREGKGVLFLPYKAGEIAALRQIVSTWMRLAIFETMNAAPGDQRLLFAIDELDALGVIDGLKDALARLRKFGGRCILGFQSIAQLRGLYGDAEAQTIVENCGNTLILRCSASEQGGTSEFASRLIGKREIVRQQTTRSVPMTIGRGGHATHTTSDQRSIEDAVMASEIEQLPDLSGFLKVASKPEWWRVTISRTQVSPK